MATKKIRFDHNGQNARADLLYDFEDFSDLLLVVPNGNMKDLKRVIPFIRINKAWETMSPVKYQIPRTIQNISNQLNKMFNGKA
jgi:hypothetical protein